MDVLLDNTGDISIASDGRMSLTTSAAELVAQRLKLKLSSQYGSWFLDEDWGVRYIDVDGDAATILVKSPNVAAISAELKTIIADTEDVERLLSYEQTFSPAARTLTVEFVVSVSGAGTVTGSVLMGDDGAFAPDGAAVVALMSIMAVELCPV